MASLSIAKLKEEAADFATAETSHDEPSLYGITDGKAVGTYLEAKFRSYLEHGYSIARGSAAKGIDLPDLNVDIKVTSQRQPQSSCPFRSARQKVFGLGYSLLIFVYDKTDDAGARTANLRILDVIFVDASCTADFTMSRRLREMVDDGANIDDVIAYLHDRNLPVDEIEARRIAEEVLASPPAQGYLTISNALQWRLQYGHVIDEAGRVPGVSRIGGA